MVEPQTRTYARVALTPRRGRHPPAARSATWARSSFPEPNGAVGDPHVGIVDGRYRREPTPRQLPEHKVVPDREGAL